MWRQNFLSKSMVKSPNTFPFICVGNKSDIVTENPVTRAVSQTEVQEYCESHGVTGSLETSAKNNTNVE